MRGAKHSSVGEELYEGVLTNHPAFMLNNVHPNILPIGRPSCWLDLCSIFDEGCYQFIRVSGDTGVEKMRPALFLHMKSEQLRLTNKGVRFWDLASGNLSLWSQWVKRRYLRKANIWCLEPTASCSSAWRHILSARGWLVNRARYVIFEGHSINIWYDPWLNGRGLKEALGRELLTWGPPHQTPLSVLIDNGKWTKPSRWNPTLEALWDEITQLDVGGIGDDILIWPDSRSGRLSFKENHRHIYKEQLRSKSRTTTATKSE
ncbi:hypothetical protein QJS10_CPB13g00841 [Acorus calamus]|uniref:Uncharacterized protein n=1 Tax=Acorus calamus TaxID=4465 RepID=A0AAV9DH99_ACOCL|nr:hypothetical protein QJS10_CPB13g00841 [Acorus calamus]